jgi:general secretion pathway protein I
MLPSAEALPRAARSASGFTLIEVLAALVIVALGMLGVIEAVSQQARNGAYLREKTIAHWIAMNVVTEQRLQPAPPPVADSSDDVEFAGQRWRWTMRRMDVSVRPADARDDVVLASVTGFYGSAVGPAGGGTIAWNGAGNGAPGQDEDGGDSGENDGEKNPPVTPPAEGVPPIINPKNDDDEE